MMIARKLACMKTEQQQRLTTGAFSRRVEISPSGVRNLVKRGVLTPDILSDGRFAFSEADVLVARTHRRPGGRPRKNREASR